MMNISISLAQINIQLGQPKANFDVASQMVTEAARQNSQVVLLPELWSTGYDLSNAQALARENQAFLPEIARLACENSVFIGGSLLLERQGSVYNTFVFQPPTQDEPIFYSKIHLFRLMSEDRWLTPGDQLQQVEAPWGQTGLAICYDLRFPEMFRHYALAGSRLFLISAEWPLARIQHWQILLRARAIENQCFIAATNCTGLCGGETFGGSSAVISPWGETLVEASTGQPELHTIFIDMDQVPTVRSKIPILKDRRPDVYG